MEQLGLGWLSELGKQGLGYLLFGLTLIAVVWLVKYIFKLQEQIRKDAERMAAALEQNNSILKNIDTNLPELTKVQSNFAQVLQGLAKQLDMGDDRSRERADLINKSIDRVGASLERMVAAVERLHGIVEFYQFS